MSKYLLKIRNGGSVVTIKANNAESIIAQGSELFGLGFIRRCSVFRFDADYLTWVNPEHIEEEAVGFTKPVQPSWWNEDRDDIVYGEPGPDVVLWQQATEHVASQSGHATLEREIDAFMALKAS